MRAKLTAALVGTNLAALLFAAWSVGATLSEPVFPRAERNPADPLPASPPIFARVSSEALLSSPLFTPSRQPHSEPEQAAMQIPPPTPPRLVGIVEQGSTARRALLETVTGESRRLMHRGEVFEGWVVTEIHRDAVTLTQPLAVGGAVAGAQLSLHLHPAREPAAAANE